MTGKNEESTERLNRLTMPGYITAIFPLALTSRTFHLLEIFIADSEGLPHLKKITFYIFQI